MKALFATLMLLIVIAIPAGAQDATCSFDGKDYDSPGFGIPTKSGLVVKARFGCKYRCVCPNGSKWRVTHVLEEKHISLDIMSNKTGGPQAAKWFICPQSVKVETWKALRDEIGHIYAYTVEPNEEPFPVSKMKTSKQIQDWLKNSCQ